MSYSEFFKTYSEKSITGRYLTLNDLKPLVKNRPHKTIGSSVNGAPIYALTYGNGRHKILMWSQMHGNESTTTKALLDLFNFLESDEEIAKSILSDFTLLIIPMLNPDGSKAYTRVNANGIDLNRDFCNLSQPETRALVETYENFKPDYCFNLHDQRTIFGAGDSGLPATVSFLAPSFDEQRTVNDVRKRAMEVILTMKTALKSEIPGQIARFDDGFNLNCAGDTFQNRGTPTILFEAGHFQGDYQREATRRLIFMAYLSAFSHINENVIVSNVIENYLKIPQNKTNFNDFVYKNVKINYDGNEIIANLAAQYSEEISEGNVVFVANLVSVDTNSFGHFEYDAESASFQNGIPQIGQKADFTIGGKRFVNGMPS